MSTPQNGARPYRLSNVDVLNPSIVFQTYVELMEIWECFILLHLNKFETYNSQEGTQLLKMRGLKLQL